MAAFRRKIREIPLEEMVSPADKLRAKLGHPVHPTPRNYLPGCKSHG